MTPQYSHRALPGAAPCLRRGAAALTVLALVASALALIAAPAAAQSGVRVFVLANDMEDDEDREEQWQMRVAVSATGRCTPTGGVVEHLSPWIGAGSQIGVDLNVGECVFEISAVVRQAALRTDCWFTARLSWVAADGTTPAPGTAPADGSVFTTRAPDGVSRLSVARKPGSGCAVPGETGFLISAAETVAPLPASSADADLLALARRAAELSEFDVRVKPDYPSGSVPAGCDADAGLTVRGDGRRVYQPLAVIGDGCRFRAAVVGAKAPFEVFGQAGRSFTVNDRSVELGSLVRLPRARIAIIQDVRGPAGGGEVSYAINRSCGDADAGPAAAPAARSVLHAGRFTVHSPAVPNHGPAYTYPATAASADSSDIVGCSVKVTVGNVPAHCVVDGELTRTLTWTAASPLRNFDFEFDITCGTGATTTTTTSAADAPEGAPGADAGAEVRIVARRLANGKIEFGLQQQRSDGSWGDRQSPARRYFPASAPAGRWLQSSPLTLAAAAAPEDAADDVAVRIAARRHSDGRVEFGLQERAADGSWDDRSLPERRYVPADSVVGRWLNSTPQTVGAG